MILLIAAACSAQVEVPGEVPGAVLTFTGVQFYSRTLKYEKDEETVQQLVIPVFAAFTVTDNLSFRVYQTLSTSELEYGDDLSGLGNTRVRGALSLFRNRLIIYLGSSLPIASVTPEEKTAYLSELLYREPLQFGVTRLTEGFDLDGGLVFAQPFGKLSLGLGAGYTLRGEFDRFSQSDYSPGDAINATAGFHFRSGITSLRGGVVYVYYEDDSIGEVIFENGDELSFSMDTTFRPAPITFTLMFTDTIKGTSAEQDMADVVNVFTNRLNGGIALAYSLLNDSLILKTQANVKLFTNEGETSAKVASFGGGFRLIITDNVALDVLADFVVGNMDFGETDISGFNLGSHISFGF